RKPRPHSACRRTSTPTPCCRSVIQWAALGQSAVFPWPMSFMRIGGTSLIGIQRDPEHLPSFRKGLVSPGERVAHLTHTSSIFRWEGRVLTVHPMHRPCNMVNNSLGTRSQAHRCQDRADRSNPEMAV